MWQEASWMGLVAGLLMQGLIGGVWALQRFLFASQQPTHQRGGDGDWNGKGGDSGERHAHAFQ